MRLSPPSGRIAVAGALAAACALVAVAVVLLVDDDSEPASDRGAVTPTEERSPAAGGEAAEEQRGDAEPDPAPRPGDGQPEERRVERTVRRYVAALNDHDGGRVCTLHLPDALARVDLPRPGGDCGAAVGASIGYRDPRGFPHWRDASLEDFVSTTVEGDQARVTATIVSRFHDREEPSVEDDVIYLERRGERWLIAQPSATLYRAIGAPEVPPEVLSPPG